LSVSEFEIIRRYFTRSWSDVPGVILGVGDDAAIVRATSDQDLVIAADVINEGIHFPVDTTAEAVGHKALAVNLSDLAAMGADPAWFTMTLSLPAVDEQWLERFASGLFALADAHNIFLIGGDTVRGPLSIAINAVGQIPRGTALRRDGAAIGDAVYVSGNLGDAALAIQQLGHDPHHVNPVLRKRLDFPEPRLELGRYLREFASSCIDISDGLAADLSHILEASGVGAVLRIGHVPLSAEVSAAGPENALKLAMGGGDDYELCFTVPPQHVRHIDEASRATGVRLTHIGDIVDEPGLTVLDRNNNPVPLHHLGHDHFIMEDI